MRYTGPRLLTRKEVAAYSAMPAVELRKLRNALVAQNTDFGMVKQITTIMHRRAAYERAVPANKGRATID